MDWFIVIVGILLLVFAIPIALMWWKLARKAAPYRDEGGATAPPAPKKDEAEVIVISSSGETKRGA